MSISFARAARERHLYLRESERRRKIREKAAARSRKKSAEKREAREASRALRASDYGLWLATYHPEIVAAQRPEV